MTHWPRRSPSRRIALRRIDRMPPGVDDGMTHSFLIAPYRDWGPIVRHPGWLPGLASAPMVRVPLASLVATQEDVARAEVARHIQQPQLVPYGTTFLGRPSDKPLVVRFHGVLYIMDGHHRLEGLRRKGRTHARVRFVDLDAMPEENGLAKDIGIGAAVWFIGVPLAVWGLLVVNGYFHPGDAP